MWPRYAEFEVDVVQPDARGYGWVSAGSGLLHGGNMGDAVITRASHVRRAFDSEYARTSPTFRLDVLRTYMYVKYRRSRVHRGPGAESKLAPLQATYPCFADTFDALRLEMGLSDASAARRSWESAGASDEDSATTMRASAFQTSDPCPRPLADRLASFSSARRELHDWLDEVAAVSGAEKERDAAVRL